jgi:hypothetical protein
VLASQEISIEEWQNLNTTADRLQYLLDAYVGRMLTRHINSRTYLKTKSPNTKEIRMWLVWLAQQMQRESKTEFLIEEMQPQLIDKKLYQWQYWFLLFTINILCTGIIIATNLLPYFQLPGSLRFFRFILVLGLIPGFILATESKADAVKLILFPWMSLFCWLFKRDLPTEVRQYIPIMHEIDLSNRLRVRIPSFQEIKREVLSPLRLVSLLCSWIYLIPIILFIHSLHILLANIIYSLGFKKLGIAIIKNIKKIIRNTNSQTKEYNQGRYISYTHKRIFLLIIEYTKLTKIPEYIVLKIISFFGTFFCYQSTLLLFLLHLYIYVYSVQ